jgi:hypothetical protein
MSTAAMVVRWEKLCLVTQKNVGSLAWTVLLPKQERNYGHKLGFYFQK